MPSFEREHLNLFIFVAFAQELIERRDVDGASMRPLFQLATPEGSEPQQRNVFLNVALLYYVKYLFTNEFMVLPS